MNSVEKLMERLGTDASNSSVALYPRHWLVMLRATVPEMVRLRALAVRDWQGMQVQYLVEGSEAKGHG